MKNIAVIPARSGSKGLRDKNIRELGGKPLLAYSIEAALESRQFEEVMVSTDSEKYAEIAMQYGATVPFLRSNETAGDTASTWDTVREVLWEYQGLGRSFDTVCVLQPTSPLRIAEDIEKGYILYREKDAKAVVSVCEMEHSPLLSNVLPDDMCMDHFIDDAYYAKRRQGMKTYYRINGALYIVDTRYLQVMNNLYGENTYACVMPGKRSVDIDTADDLLYAQYLLDRKERS